MHVNPKEITWFKETGVWFTWRLLLGCCTLIVTQCGVGIRHFWAGFTCLSTSTHLWCLVILSVPWTSVSVLFFLSSTGLLKAVYHSNYESFFQFGCIEDDIHVEKYFKLETICLRAFLTMFISHIKISDHPGEWNRATHKSL